MGQSRDTMLHNRQFVIGPRQIFEAKPGWAHHRLSGDLVLSRSTALPLLTANCPAGGVQSNANLVVQLRVLLGVAIAPNLPAVLAAPEASLLADLRNWTGRWVLLAGDRLIADAAGLLGCYFAEGWVSSSPALLHEVLGRPGVARSRSLVHGTGVEWYPPPTTRFEGTSRLPAGYTIDLRSGETTKRPPLAVAARSVADTLEFIETDLVNKVAAAAGAASRIVVPLTAGYDSRLLLAAALSAGLKPVAVTQLKTRMSEADRVLPPRIAAAAGIEHFTVPVAEEDPAHLELYDEHTAGHIIDIDRSYFARGQLFWAREGDLILRGGAFEVGRCFYWERLPEVMPMAEELARRFDGERDPAIIEGLRIWCHRHQSDQSADWRDIFYLEQRVGGWLSAVEQSLDLVAGTRFHPANSIAFYEAVLSLPVEIRRQSQHHVDLVARLAPALARFPYNPRRLDGLPDAKGLVDRLKSALSRRVRSRLSRLGRRS